MAAEAIAASPHGAATGCARTILARSGLEISRLGLGLSRLHYLSADDGVRLVHAALDLGITHFDTARLYGDGFSEAVLGRALAGRGGRATVATKFGIVPSRLIEAAGPFAHPLRGARSVLRRVGALGAPRRSWSVETLRISLERSLRALKSERVDILFLHEPRAGEVEGADDLFAELVRLRQAGRIGAVGISTDAADVAVLLGRFGRDIDVVQAPEPSWREGAVVPDITFGAVGSGPQTYGAAKPGRDAVLKGLARALARRPQGCVLVGTTNPAHLRELAAVAREQGT